jgi:hypothetical protein
MDFETVSECKGEEDTSTEYDVAHASKSGDTIVSMTPLERIQVTAQQPAVAVQATVQLEEQTCAEVVPKLATTQEQTAELMSQQRQQRICQQQSHA